jgi:hypothetical protein
MWQKLAHRSHGATDTVVAIGSMAVAEEGEAATLVTRATLPKF